MHVDIFGRSPRRARVQHPDKAELRRERARLWMARFRVEQRQRWLANCREAQKRYRQRHPERPLASQRKYREKKREKAWAAALEHWRKVARAWLEAEQHKERLERQQQQRHHQDAGHVPA